MRILIIGLGSIGKKHVKAVQCIYPSAELYAFRSGNNADKYPGVINIFNQSEIADLSFDFVIISNPTSEHKKTIEYMIGYKLPLFIEKPLSYSLDISDVIQRINDNKIPAYIACNLRFHDCIRFIKGRLQGINYRLNEVNVYCGSYLPEWRPDSDYRRSYSAHSDMGGGVHLDLIHEIDYLYWFFGKPVSVRRNFRSQSSLKLSSFDYANYLLDYDGFCVNVVLNYYRRDPKRYMELVFDNETWNVDLLMNKVTCRDKEIFISDRTISDTYLDQMKYFMECLNNRTGTFNTVSDAYEVLKICLEK
jgi:predicted dehydrogenase